MPTDFRGATASDLLRERLRWFRFRGLVLVLVFACGLVAFTAGAAPSERPELVDTDLLERAYYTLTLFVLGGTDLGVPRSGPEWAQALLWVAYFCAPAVTASALVEAIARAVGPGILRLRRIRDHVVIGGAGRIGMLYLRRLRERDPNCPVILVERRASRANLEIARALFGAEIVSGDIADLTLLSTLRLHRARRVLLLTGDDFANLEAASAIIERVPSLASRTVIHVGDLQLLDELEETRVHQLCENFNSYRVAAQHLVESNVTEYFDHTKGTDCVVLVGFGRFGQTVLAELQRRAIGEFDTAVIVDLHAEDNALRFEEKVGFATGYARHVIQGDIHNPRAWGRILPLLENRQPLIVVGCGDDPVNLRAALQLRRRCPSAKLVVRSFTLSGFAKDLAQDKEWDCFGVAELLERSMPDAWFERS